MSYEEAIKQYCPLTFDGILDIAKQNVPDAYKSKPWTYPGLEHGTALLKTEEQLYCYLASYGEMHKGKLTCAAMHFPFNDIDCDFEIIDWGCGQGIGSVYFVDELRKRTKLSGLRKVTLIEPSEQALARAQMNVKQAVGEDVYVEAVNNYLPSVSQNDKAIGGLHIEESTCIHIFSNILDIPTIDLKELAFMVGGTGYKHYFVCVGPVNFGNDRIFSFQRYFQIENNGVFFTENRPQYGQLPNGKWYSCAGVGFKIIRQEGKPFLVPLSYYPPKQFFASYRLDAIEELDKANEGNIAFWNSMNAFEVLAPFDIGASIYEDIDPILAVISNIITRGLPTKSPLTIEETLNNLWHYGTLTEKYGTLRYNISDQDVVESNEDLLREIPIAIARMEKVVIEAVLTGHLSIDAKEWNVLVKECDVPCASLAFRDLTEIYNHLTAMSKEYSSFHFPKVNLTVLSEDFYDSPLQLDAQAYKNSKKIDKNFVYDMVVDFSIKETVDAANVQFSEFKVKNDCYFNVRSSLTLNSTRYVYTTDRIDYSPVTYRDEQGNHVEIKEQKKHLEYFLQLLFRKKSFRPGQLPILNRALQNKGVIGLLPTGGGKSLTYQIAAMLQPGITVVIDPLKSLMQDQYDGLIAAGIDACTYVNGDLDKEERAAHERMMEYSQVIFTFMSPERLCIYDFRERLENMHELGVYFSYGVIDEVHCVSEWGQDFRFSYLHLGRNLYSYVHSKTGHISLFGLTATASFDVLSDVERELSGNGAFDLDPDTVVRYENSNRLELQYKIEKIDVDYQPKGFWTAGSALYGMPLPVDIGDTWSIGTKKSEFLKDYISKIPQYLRELQTEDSIKRIISRFEERESLQDIDGDSLKVSMANDYFEKKQKYDQAGIVFCPHVNTSGISVNENAKRLGEVCSVGTFAGSDLDGADEDKGNQSMLNMKRFRENEIPIMVATKAFGMGIDKPNVRFTVNMNYSSSLESFVQEAGRAGRDRKMALAVILLSNYRLVRLSYRYRNIVYPLSEIVNKWFKEDDLNFILNHLGITITDKSVFDYCDPLTDIVKLKCKTDNAVLDKDGNQKYTKTGVPLKQWWNCTPKCSKYNECNLRLVDKKYQKVWIYHKDLQQYLEQNKIRIPKDSYDYQSADYNTVIFFFDNNFKGEIEEKMKLHHLLSEKNMYYFIGNDKQDKPKEKKDTKGFMDVVLNATVGTEVVAVIRYDDESYADIAKAIYRMCVIGLIDDFTQDYGRSVFRILLTRKKNGKYYERLKQFLMRYYAEERAENEVEKASVKKGNNEIHKCLSYLTEFIYDKVALKRKRAIDDIRRFCLVGIDDSKDWKEINEDLKDEIYYYFNSKYAREGYKTDNGEEFSLLDDTDRSKKSSFDILFKYMRVVDNDVMGGSEVPRDSIKHLQGAVRLIRRSETETNATLCMLNVYCLLFLKVGSNQAMRDELESSFIDGYKSFKKDTKDYDVFAQNIDRFIQELNIKGRNIASEEDVKLIEDLRMAAELETHTEWVDNLRYTK